MDKKEIVLPDGVMKIRHGYNPNSSSIGTIVYSFPLAYVLFSTLLAILVAVTGGKAGKKAGWHKGEVLHPSSDTSGKDPV